MHECKQLSHLTLAPRLQPLSPGRMVTTDLTVNGLRAYQGSITRSDNPYTEVIWSGTGIMRKDSPSPMADTDWTIQPEIVWCESIGRVDE